MSRLSRPAIVLSCIALTGCASSVVAVKDVTANPEAYQASKFASAPLAENIRKVLPVAANSGWNRLEIRKEIVTTSSDGKTEKADSTVVYTSMDNGLIGMRNEVSSNGIPFLLSYSNSYHGLFSLRYQSIPLRGQVTAPILEVKAITSITPLPIAPNSQFAVKYDASTTMAIMNFSTWEVKCDTGARFPASQININLAGKAFEVNCVDSFQNTVSSRGKYVFLEQYGLAVQTELVRAAAKTSYKIVEVKL